MRVDFVGTIPAGLVDQLVAADDAPFPILYGPEGSLLVDVPARISVSAMLGGMCTAFVQWGVDAYPVVTRMDLGWIDE